MQIGPYTKRKLTARPLRNLERLLVRDAGLTRTEAEALLRSGFEGLSAVRDAGGSEKADELAAIRRLTQTIRT